MKFISFPTLPAFIPKANMHAPSCFAQLASSTCLLISRPSPELQKQRLTT